jgi:lysophospholipase L1-like esterase
MKPMLLSVLFLGLSLAVAAQDDAEMLKRSLVSLGDPARLQHVLARARRGEGVVVAVIGGSITAGASASTEEHRWGNLVAAWWRDTFPQATITFINAGIGATGSDLGAHRAAAHLLVHRPDLVVAEYGVNDPNSQDAAETLEAPGPRPSQPARPDAPVHHEQRRRQRAGVARQGRPALRPPHGQLP